MNRRTSVVLSFLFIALALVFTACPLEPFPEPDPTEDPTENPTEPSLTAYQAQVVKTLTQNLTPTLTEAQVSVLSEAGQAALLSEDLSGSNDPDLVIPTALDAILGSQGLGSNSLGAGQSAIEAAHGIIAENSMVAAALEPSNFLGNRIGSRSAAAVRPPMRAITGDLNNLFKEIAKKVHASLNTLPLDDAAEERAAAQASDGMVTILGDNGLALNTAQMQEVVENLAQGMLEGIAAISNNASPGQVQKLIKQTVRAASAAVGSIDNSDLETDGKQNGLLVKAISRGASRGNQNFTGVPTDSVTSEIAKGAASGSAAISRAGGRQNILISTQEIIGQVASGISEVMANTSTTAQTILKTTIAAVATVIAEEPGAIGESLSDISQTVSTKVSEAVSKVINVPVTDLVEAAKTALKEADPTINTDSLDTLLVESVNSGVALAQNHAPTVSITPPSAQFITGETVSVSATISDVDGNDLQVRWSLTAYPGVVPPVLSYPDGGSVSFLATKEGTYTLQLMVTDGMADPVYASTSFSVAEDPNPSPLDETGIDQAWDSIIGHLRYNVSGESQDTWVFPDIAAALSELDSLLITNPEVGKAAALKALLTLTTVFVDPNTQELLEQFGVQNYPTTMAGLTGYVKTVVFEAATMANPITGFAIDGQSDLDGDGVVDFEEQFIAFLKNARSNSMPTAAVSSLSKALGTTLAAVTETLDSFSTDQLADNPAYTIAISYDWVFATADEALNSGWPSMDGQTPMDFVLGIPELQLLQAQLEILNSMVTMTRAYRLGINRSAYQAYLDYFRAEQEQFILPEGSQAPDPYDYLDSIGQSPFTAESFTLSSTGLADLALAKNLLVSAFQKVESAMAALAQRSSADGDAYTVQPDSVFLSMIDSTYTPQDFTNMFTSHSILGKKVAASLVNPDTGLAVPAELFTSFEDYSWKSQDWETGEYYTSESTVYSLPRGETAAYSYYADESNWPTAPEWATSTGTFYDSDGSVTGGSEYTFLHTPYIFPGKYFEAPFSGLSAFFELDVNLEPLFYTFDEGSQTWIQETGTFDPAKSYYTRMPDASFGGALTYGDFVDPSLPEGSQYVVQENGKIRIYSWSSDSSTGNSMTPQGEEFKVGIDRYRSTGSYFLSPRTLPQRVVLAGFDDSGRFTDLAAYLSLSGLDGYAGGRYEILNSSNYSINDAMGMIENGQAELVVIPRGQNTATIRYQWEIFNSETPIEVEHTIATTELGTEYSFDPSVVWKISTSTAWVPDLGTTTPYFSGSPSSIQPYMNTLLTSDTGYWGELPVQWDDLDMSLPAEAITLVLPPETSPNYQYIIDKLPNLGDATWVEDMGITLVHASSASEVYAHAITLEGASAVVNMGYRSVNLQFYTDFPQTYEGDWDEAYYRTLGVHAEEYTVFGGYPYPVADDLDDYLRTDAYGFEE
ncbi:PKD domain-containing protein [Spirochaeta lutea]|uniref:EF-hand domain-containing protein n=1 Tax=Spirochaeta lutea TaxID=1480694 RepID=A0A098QXM4_9SPIO|nr:PKD domain-containing protein [Spirochaeta lutea]KGE71222.1 hypothetical protein DC28_12255 [Spirochaeta lutea]